MFTCFSLTRKSHSTNSSLSPMNSLKEKYWGIWLIDLAFGIVDSDNYRSWLITAGVSCAVILLCTFCLCCIFKIGYLRRWATDRSERCFSSSQITGYGCHLVLQCLGMDWVKKDTAAVFSSHQLVSRFFSSFPSSVDFLLIVILWSCIPVKD